MKKINCNIANDLIPLYIDEVISQDSQELLEEHISKCKQCQQTMERMKQDIPIVEERNVNPFKKLRKKLVVRSVIIILLLIFIFSFYTLLIITCSKCGQKGVNMNWKKRLWVVSKFFNR